jgi:hypothetical protein
VGAGRVEPGRSDPAARQRSTNIESPCAAASRYPAGGLAGDAGGATTLEPPAPAVWGQTRPLSAPPAIPTAALPRFPGSPALALPALALPALAIRCRRIYRALARGVVSNDGEPGAGALSLHAEAPEAWRAWPTTLVAASKPARGGSGGRATPHHPPGE